MAGGRLVEAACPTSLELGRAALRFCNSYNRLPTLLDLWAESSISARDWLILLGEEWSVCDNIGAHAEGLIRHTPLGDAQRDSALRPFLMTKAEQAALGALPNELTLFRGCYGLNKWGLSWSLDRATAERFPTLHRYQQDGQPLLVKAAATKTDILAVKLDRNEAEIIAWRPRHVSTSNITAQSAPVATYALPNAHARGAKP